MRRHVRIQIAQDGARMTVERVERDGVELVEASSHEDSCPSHRAWQGRCHSLSGEKVVEGERYPDLASSIGYGSVDGLLGANCRHSFGPYRHGAPRAYGPNPKHPSGLPGEEVYECRQKQRRIERRIREAKRELRGAQIALDRAPSLESRSALLRAQERLKGRQAAMRALVDEANGKARPGAEVLQRKPNREWAGDMPKGTNLKASGRKLDEFLGGAGASASLKASGISKTATRRAVAEEMARRGGTVADFAALTAGEQQAVFGNIVKALKNPARIEVAKHAAKTSVDRAAPVYDKLDHRHVAKIAKLIGDCDNAPARLYLRYEGDLSLIDRSYQGVPHFSRIHVGVLMDVAADYSNARSPMSTWFHEFGHHIDYIATGTQNAAAKKAQGMSVREMYASAKYKDNIFDKTLRAEAERYVDATHERIKSETAARLDTLDLRGMRDDGLLSDATYSALRRKLRVYSRVTSPGFKAEDYGYTPEEVKQAKAYKKEIVSAVKKDPAFRAATKRQRAYEAVSKELMGLPDAAQMDVSDIFGGATGNKAVGNWGHWDKSYWDSENTALAREAFAEFYSASISNEESLAVLKRYFPDSAAIFDDIIDAIEKGVL